MKGLNMYPLTITYTPAAANAAGYANDVAVTPVTLVYALTATTPADGLAHEITVLNNSINDHSDKTLTFVGTDADGIAKTLSGVTGPGISTSITTTGHFFKTLTSVTVSSTTNADTFDIGWNAVAAGPTLPLNWRQESFQVSLGVDVTGTINYGVEYCLESFREAAPSTKSWITHSVLAAKTVDSDSILSSPCTAVRFKLNSITAGATAKLTVIQG